MMRARSLPLAAVMLLGLVACNTQNTAGPSGSSLTTSGTATQTTSTPADVPQTQTPSTPAPGTTVPSSSTSTTTTSSSTASPTSPPNLQSAFEAVKSGVVRFEVAQCVDGDTGSGFAISPTLVVTAAHVVADGQVVRTIQGTTAVGGTVIGLDPGADVALVRTATPLSGKTLAFSDNPPRVGDQVGAIGFPERDPLTFNIGTVSGLDRKSVIDGVLRHGMVELDANTEFGSSGGPVINSSGKVLGLVDAETPGTAGRRLAVSSATAQPLVAAWQVSPQSVTPPDCSTAVDPDGTPLPAADFPDTAAQQALWTLNLYFGSINNGDYATAYAQLAQQSTLSNFKEAVTSSDDSSFTVDSITDDGGSPVVWLDFISTQDPGRGPSDRPQETCTAWSLDYVFTKKNGLWLIDSTRQHPGVAEDSPCGD